jgi:hypothetical protein
MDRQIQRQQHARAGTRPGCAALAVLRLIPTLTPRRHEQSWKQAGCQREELFDAGQSGGVPGWRRSADRTRLHANSLLTGNFTGNFAILGE